MTLHSRSLLIPLIGFMVVIDVIILDQLTKWAVLEMILRPAIEGTNVTGMDLFSWLAEPPARLPFVTVEALPHFNWVMIWNKGISFGLLKNDEPYFLIIATLALSAAFALWLVRTRHLMPALALAMVIGGALGNVVDRVRFGAVADFLDFYAYGYHYPAFNLADSCITVGIALLVIDGLFFEPKRAAKNEDHAP